MRFASQMIKPLAVAFCVLSLIFAIHNGAASNEISMQSLWKNAHTQEMRIKLAREIRVQLYVDEFLKRVPKISPQVNEWLNGELNSSSNRLMAVMNSPEYSNRQARLAIESIDHVLRQISERKDEAMDQWVGLASLLMDRGFIEHLGIICEKKIISVCPWGKPASARLTATMISGMYARTIVLGVIGPKFGTGFLNPK